MLNPPPRVRRLSARCDQIVSRTVFADCYSAVVATTYCSYRRPLMWFRRITHGITDACLIVEAILKYINMKMSVGADNLSRKAWALTNMHY